MNKKIFLFILLALISFNLFSQSGYRDVVSLKNGSVIKGVIIEQIPGEKLKIETSDGSLFVYQMSEVAKITKEKIPQVQPSQPGQSNSQICHECPQIGMNYMEKTVSSQSKGTLKLQDFEKTNGMIRNVMGQEFYLLEYKLVISTEVTIWKAGDFGPNWKNFYTYTKQPTGWDAYTIGAGTKRYDRGTLITLWGELHLIETEKGYRVEAFKNKSVAKGGKIVKDYWGEKSDYDRGAGNKIQPTVYEIDVPIAGTSQFVLEKSSSSCTNCEQSQVDQVEYYIQKSWQKSKRGFQKINSKDANNLPTKIQFDLASLRRKSSSLSGETVTMNLKVAITDSGKSYDELLFVTGSSTEGKEAAFQNMLKMIPLEIEKVIYKYFPIEATISELRKKKKTGELKKVDIRVSELILPEKPGILLFVVFKKEEVDKVGLGKAQSMALLDFPMVKLFGAQPDLRECKVLTGADALTKAFEEQEELLVLGSSVLK